MATTNTATPPRSTTPQRNTIINPTDMRSVVEKVGFKVKNVCRRKTTTTRSHIMVIRTIHRSTNTTATTEHLTYT